MTATTGFALKPYPLRRTAHRHEPESADVFVAGGEDATRSEVLLRAALDGETGETTRFIRQDGDQEVWRIMRSLPEAPPSVHANAPGTWGPDEASSVAADRGHWHKPWTAS